MEQINSFARNNIKLYRKMRKMTQKELAEALDVTHSSVSAWEIGKNSIDMQRLNQICQVLNVSITEIISDNNDEKIHRDEEHKEMMDYIDKRPEVKRLLKATSDSRSEDIVVAIKLLEAMKKR